MNPYEILGVTPSSTPEEIRSAYMALVKKYHPDRYQDSALKKQAEEKMKQINAAYDMLTKEPKQSAGSYGSGYGQSTYGPGSSYGQGGYSGYGQGGYSGYGQSSYSGYGTNSQTGYRGQYAAEFNKVRTYINNGDIEAASAVLRAIPVRNAEWNFLYGMCFYRSGQYGKAYEYVSRACQMDPSNTEYSRAYGAMRGAGESASTWSADGETLRYCGLCSSILCANALMGLCCR